MVRREKNTKLLNRLITQETGIFPRLYLFSFRLFDHELLDNDNTDILLCSY